MKYRAEIDGLRALAVVPVILFHAGFELFGGGFVGVDIFFVISGYLITTILVDDIENKRFNLVYFYERRARRILPALFFVILACLPFAWWWMLPMQLEDFAQSLVAVSLFASNILFWRESDYFALAAEQKPLLHTWSLAVEEQYYLLFPLFLLFFLPFGKKRVFWTIMLFAALSLALSEWGWRHQATANFYLAPTRAWELFAGSIAAFIVRARGVRANDGLALLGLGAILFSILAYDKTTPFPSLYALVPVAGVFLLIVCADHQTFAAKLLSNKIFVGIGLISYSAYLWHQPLFAFARLRAIDPPSPALMGALSLVAFILAIFSWRFVEQPFRNKERIGRTALFSVCGLGLAGLIVLGGWGMARHGDLWRLPQQLVPIYTVNDGAISDCVETRIACEYGRGAGKPTMLVYGDSHARHLTRALVERLAGSFDITLVVGGSCFMGNDIRMDDVADAPDLCREKNAYLRRLQGKYFDVVMTSQLWTSHAYGTFSAQEVRRFLDDRILKNKINAGLFLVVGNNPVNPKACLARRYIAGDSIHCSPFAQEKIFAAVAADYATKKVQFIHPYQLIADSATPDRDAQGQPIYGDMHHLNHQGARRVVDLIARAVRPYETGVHTGGPHPERRPSY